MKEIDPTIALLQGMVDQLNRHKEAIERRIEWEDRIEQKLDQLQKDLETIRKAII